MFAYGTLIIILIVVGIVAGIVSTAAGLASLVSYPVLLALGLPPVTANVTNTVGLVFTSFGAVPASRRELRGHGRELKVLLPLTLIGSIVGAILLFVIPAATFAKVVPFFILVAAVLVLIPRHIHVKQPGEVVVTPKWVTALAWLGIFLVGTYTGYFGAAGGVLMLSILSFISDTPFAVYNAQKNLALGLANIVSAVVYGLRTPIKWHYVIPLGIGFLIGGSLGPHIVRHVPAQLLKIVIGIGALGLAASLFKSAYGL
ncbi:sulfite exporter TauE/SafE family protein [Lactiplantibacillus pentosus]|uniref:sulfite exporter TauE/SafE family protein n=1 Tax=Lactiplantibacillus pentosus TaxID=1589 RepID=UPI003C1F624F